MRRIRTLSAVALVALLVILAFSGVEIAAEETSTTGPGFLWVLVFEDKNSNGIIDETMADMIDGVTFKLYSQASDGSWIPVAPEEGKVSAPGAGYPAGWVDWYYLPILTTYRLVMANCPDGYMPVGPLGGEVIYTGCGRQFQFLIGRKPRLNGYKFEDMNENGVMDDGEAGIPGVTINLNGGASSTVTNQDGFFSFEVIPGTYNVAVNETTAPGYYPTTPTSIDVEMLAGVDKTVYFGNAPFGSIYGKKWNDKNKNGQQDSCEPPVEGLTIKLTGKTTSGELVNLETKTASDGSYGFTGLQAGTYTITEVVPSGWQATGPNHREVTLLPGQKVTGIDFFNAQVCTTYGSICGKKWNDKNKNGKRDCYEPALAGVTIKLSGGLVVKETKTASDGSYGFPGLQAGTYTITEVVPSGWQATGPNPREVTLLPGQKVTGIDFFNAQVCGGCCFALLYKIL